MKFDGTDTYPVGILRALQQARARRSMGPLRYEWRYLRRQAKARSWRAVRNTFNGYLVEHGGHRHNCGSGWTRRTAERRADRLCAAERMSESFRRPQIGAEQ